jgi:hypothetical protein
MITTRCFFVPYNNDWIGFDPDFHDVVVMDEYEG